MLSLEAVKKLLEDKSYKRSKDLRRNDEIYYEMSLHIDGACPAYEDTRYGTMVYPPTFYGLEYQKIFEVKHFSKFQNESIETRNWRMANYHPFTQEPFIKAIQVIIGAIFQDGNYVIDIDNKEDYDYIWGENFEGKHLVGFLNKYFQSICNDPNAYFVTIPKYSRLEQVGKVEPVEWFVPSVDMIYASDDEIIFKRDDYVWWVNRIGYFRYKEEKGKYSLQDEGGYYAHLLDRNPFYIAGGIWNTKKFYQSWLNAAKPIADEYIGEKSLSTLVNKQTAHPLIAAADEDCPSCENGKIQWCKKCNAKASECNCNSDDLAYDTRWTLADCTKCSGNGRISHDPAKWYLVPPDQMDKDIVKITSFNTETPKVQFENVKECENRILRALHLNYIEEAQSGVAKDKDLETRYQFLTMIANSLFDHHLYNWIKDILALRNVTVSNGEVVPYSGGFKITKPVEFNIQTASELMEHVEEMPQSMINKQVEDLADKKYGGDEVLIKKVKLIHQLDELANMPQSKIQFAMSMGGATREQLQLHLKLPFILDQIEREKGAKFLLEKDFNIIKKEIDSLFVYVEPLTIDDQEGAI